MKKVSLEVSYLENGVVEIVVNNPRGPVSWRLGGSVARPYLDAMDLLESQLAAGDKILPVQERFADSQAVHILVAALNSRSWEMTPREGGEVRDDG